MAKTPKLIRAAILKAHKAETDATWAAAVKRWERALAKMHRDLEALNKAERAAAEKRSNA